MLMESLQLSVEALRLNAELARKVASRFGAMVDAAASLLRAADGAPLPVHQPIHAEHDDSDDQEDDRRDDRREDDDHDGNENERDIRPPTRPSGLGPEESPPGPECPATSGDPGATAHRRRHPRASHEDRFQQAHPRSPNARRDAGGVEARRMGR
jgi:hypothetical protein